MHAYIFGSMQVHPPLYVETYRCSRLVEHAVQGGLRNHHARCN